MLNKKLILSIILFLGLTLTACATDDGNIDAAPDKPEVVDDMSDEYGDIEIKAQDAFDIYMEKYPDTNVKELQLDKDMGKYVYKVEGFDNETEYEITIDSKNGDILKDYTNMEIVDREDLLKIIMKSDVEKVSDLVDKAMIEAGTNSKIEEWTLDVDNGRAILEIEIVKNGLNSIEYTYDIESEKLIEVDN